MRLVSNNNTSSTSRASTSNKGVSTSRHSSLVGTINIGKKQCLNDEKFRSGNENVG